MATVLDSTQTALGGPSIPHLGSRSLRFSLYAEPGLKEEARADFFRNTFAIPPAASGDCHPLGRWLDWLQTDLRFTPDDLLFGRLQGRLALHLSGGIMDNAGLLLDRFGYPYIPGSGVKGLARRAALYALHTWCIEQNGQKPTDAAEPASAICANANFEAPDDLAVAILRAVGWTDGEWKDGRTTKGVLCTDLEWAIGEGQPWLDARPRIAEFLALHHGTKLANGRPKDNFAGLIRFLDAKPIAVGYPDAPADLELDVVTCHHGDYYSQKKDNRGRVIMPEAHDTEDPVPVFFPTVAPGITFVFAVHGADAVAFARTCLKIALSTFGAGAKTAAGYGWFEVDETTRTHAGRLKSELDARRIAEARTSMEPDPKSIADFKTKKPDQLRGLINAFSGEERFWINRDEHHQLSVLHFLTVEDRSIYDAEKAKPKSKVMDALRALSAKFNRTLP